MPYETWIPEQIDSNVVTPICECGGLILEHKCALCGKKQSKVHVGPCPGCGRKTKLVGTGYCPSCNIKGRHFDSQIGDIEKKVLAKVLAKGRTKSKARVSGVIGGVRLG